MMQKSLGAAFIIAVLDILIVKFLGDLPILAVIFLFLVPFVIIGSYEKMANKSIVNMTKKIEKVEEENRHAENIRSEFAANVSHELKTPLTSISGFIETLQSGAVNDPEARDRFIDIIAIETARLKRLIDDILLLSDIESKMDNYDETVNVNVVTESVIMMLEPIAYEKEITLHNEVDKDFNIKGSNDKFKQMLVNLMENAIKYGNEGGNVWIKSEITPFERIVTVKDDGIGIEEKDIDRIAERFYRVDRSRSKKVGGTGLGLSIVKHTAALFNGELVVKSEPGKGSEFSIVMKKKTD